MIEIIPGPATASGIVAGAAIPLVTFILSHRPFKITSLQHRFLISCGISFLVWGAFVFTYAINAQSVLWSDMLSGILFFLTAIIAFGILWSLICWGFTLSLLKALAESQSAKNQTAWFALYGGGSTTQDFMYDRLSILLALGLAQHKNETIKLTSSSGHFMAIFVRILRKMYGLTHA